LAASGLASVFQEGVEADDWIASLTRLALENQVEVVIASADKDFMQLVGPRVRLLNPGDKSQVLWGESQVRDKTGVNPDQVVDWLSLVGDSVDNIPGVPGVGPKTATQLLQQFGSVDALYRQLEAVSSERLRRALAQTESEVRRNQKMIRLDDHLPHQLKLDELRPRPPVTEEQNRLLLGWGFRPLTPSPSPPEPQQGLLL
jgi:DNA polymerase I